LQLDAGYLSRILRQFERQGLIKKVRSKSDGRQSLLSLTDQGRAVLASLDQEASKEVAAMLAPLSASDMSRLTTAMETIEQLWSNDSASRSATGTSVSASVAREPVSRTSVATTPVRATTSADTLPYTLRSHKPGDMGWVVHRHGILYSKEYGWDERFEALVAGIVSEFVAHYDPLCERCWIAERDGEIIGTIFLVRHSDNVAKLRMLLVEPSARGLGLGKRLVNECVEFARQAGYRTITLWTQSNLLAARHVYAQAGFQLVHTGEPSPDSEDLYGPGSVAETWELEL
jgi:GNAT superfamily N-acetyltransferase